MRVKINNTTVLDTGAPSSTNTRRIHYFEHTFVPTQIFIELEVETVVRDIPLKLILEWESDST